MIRIKRVPLPAGMQAFARRENGAVAVYVSADLPATGRARAIRRALRAAPEAGWRSTGGPVLIPALAGAARLRRAPQSRWTYRAVFAGTAAVAIVVVAMAAAAALSRAPLGPNPGSRPQALAPGPSAGGPAGPAGSANGSSGAAYGGHGTQTGKPGTPGKAVKPGAPGAGGSRPAPQTSGKPVPAATTPGTSAPSPQPSSGSSPSPSPSPTKKPGGGSGCLTLLGIGICL
jgi:translation initiation factor IF-2